jgi:hypothetical protein
MDWFWQHKPDGVRVVVRPGEEFEWVGGFGKIWIKTIIVVIIGYSIVGTSALLSHSKYCDSRSFQAY